MLTHSIPNPMTILLVEDEPDYRRAVEELLTICGYTVVTACDGREALEVLKSRQVQLIVSDIHMPHTSGAQLHECVRNDERFRTLPFVFITGYTILRVATPLESPGLDFMVSKVPFNGLIDVVNSISASMDMAIRPT
jgi:CheY-like chemotaxis protein